MPLMGCGNSYIKTATISSELFLRLNPKKLLEELGDRQATLVI